MLVCILMGSPRKNGNTFQLLQPFIKTMEAKTILVLLFGFMIKIFCRAAPAVPAKTTGLFSVVRCEMICRKFSIAFLHAIYWF